MNRAQRAFLLISIAAVVFSQVSAAWAAGAKEVVQTTIARVRETVISDKDKLSDEELDKNLKDLISPVFDFEEMSRRCLGANWNSATAEEQREFVDLFSALLARTYLKKIKEGVETSKISITGEQIKGESVLVKSDVVREGDTVKIDYRMLRQGETWRVYDVVIENIGLVSNYRSEFAGIVRKEKMSGLLKRLREKK